MRDRQQAEWTRRRAFSVASGTVPFSEITGIGMETTSGSRGELAYRLTILTRDKPVPMSDVYNGNRSHYESIRQEILAFLHLDSEPASLFRVMTSLAESMTRLRSFHF